MGVRVANITLCILHVWANEIGPPNMGVNCIIYLIHACLFVDNKLNTRLHVHFIFLSYLLSILIVFTTRLLSITFTKPQVLPVAINIKWDVGYYVRISALCVNKYIECCCSNFGHKMTDTKCSA